MATLLIELIENILEHVYGTYPSPKIPIDLFRCALVCRTWHAIAQSLIYIEVHFDGHDERPDMLSKNPHLRQYVRQVWVGRSPRFLEQVRQDALNVLPNLQGIYFLSDICIPLLDGLAQSGNNDLEKFLRNITSFGLSNVMAFSVQHFYHFPSLRHLKLNNSSFNFEDNTPTSNGSAPPSLRPQLHSLHIICSTISGMRIIKWISGPQSAFDLTTLSSFRAVDRTNEVESFRWTGEVIKLCAPTLQDLALDPPTVYALSDPEITPETLLFPSTLFNLRVVSITIIEESLDCASYLPWLNAFFSSLPPHNRLEEIRIPCMFVDIPNIEDYVQLEEDVSQYKWGDLDHTLRGLSSLKRVTFGAYEMVERNDPNRFGKLEAVLRKEFRRLDEKGIFEFVDVGLSDAFSRFSKGDPWWEVA